MRRENYEGSLKEIRKEPTGGCMGLAMERSGREEKGREGVKGKEGVKGREW